MISIVSKNKKGIPITIPIEINNEDKWVMKEVLDYIETFMAEGIESLCIPEKYTWGGLLNAKGALTPCEAIKYYAPWPLKRNISDRFEYEVKIYLWPLYTFFIFPFNILSSLIWYPFTKIFNIKPHSVPEEAYEGDDSIRVTPEMAAKGIRP